VGTEESAPITQRFKATWSLRCVCRLAGRKPAAQEEVEVMKRWLLAVGVALGLGALAQTGKLEIFSW